MKIYKLKWKFALILILLYITPLAIAEATIYYSGQNEGWAEDPDVLNLNNWNDQPDGSGNFPSDFISGDEFHLINGDAMYASDIWTVSGTGSKFVLESGSYFDANGNNNIFTLDLGAGSTFTTASTYTGIVFGNIDPSSTFEITGLSLRTTGIPYGNLIITGPSTFPITLNGNLNVTGNLTLSGSRVLNVSSSILRTITVSGKLILEGSAVFNGANGAASSVINVTGNIEIQGGTFRGSNSSGAPTFNVGGNLQQLGGSFTGAANVGNPIFNIAGSLLLSGGNFIGTSAAGNPTFNINTNFTHTSSTYIAATSTGRPTFVMQGNGNVSTGTLSELSHNFTISGTCSFLNNLQVSNLTISGTLTPYTTLTVTGNYTNNGTFNNNTGTVIFNGTASVISGTSASNFYNLTISGTASLGSSQNLIGSLSLSNASSSFTTTGYTFTLISNSSGTARISTIPTGATINGNITMQRYIPSSGRFWYHLASPVSNAPVSNWQAGAPTKGFYITGTFTGTSVPGNGISSSGVSMYYYNSSTGAYSNYPNSSNTQLLNPRVGYRAFLRDGSAALAPTTSAKTISVTGTPNIGNQTFPLTYSALGGSPAGGWNFLGNPYPSDITGDLTNAAWNKTGLAQTSTYIWDADAQTYVSCNGGTGACAIPSSQGFWIQVGSGGGSLTSTENVKIGGSSTIYKMAATSDQLAIKLTNSASNISNKSYIRVLENATPKFDTEVDAYKLDNVPGFGISNNAISVATKSDTLYYSINSLPSINKEDTIDLYIATRNGENSLDFSEISLSAITEMYLLDKFYGSVSNVKENPVYNFDVTSDASTQGERFSLVFSASSPTGVKSVMKNSKTLNIYPNPANGNHTTISLERIKGNTAEISIIDLKGISVYNKIFSVDNGNLNETINLANINKGVYTLVCKSAEDQHTRKLIIE